MRAAALAPRRESGRSASASAGSPQLDFACRRSHRRMETVFPLRSCNQPGFEVHRGRIVRASDRCARRCLGVSVLGSTINAWLVPALVVILLAVAIWIGLRWVRSEHLDTLAAIPLFSNLPRNRLMAIL